MPNYYADTSGAGGLNSKWGSVLQKRFNFKKRKPLDEAAPRQGIYDYDDPLKQYTGKFGQYGGVMDLFDPTGAAYSKPIEDLLRMEGAGRARGAALRASRSSIPGFSGFAQLQSDLESGSDLARGLAEARTAGVESSQRFRGGLLGDIMGYGVQGERGERGYEQERSLRREQMAHEKYLARKNRKKGVSLQLPGGFGVGFSA